MILRATLALGLLWATPLAAQGADIIRGRVTSASGSDAPIENASVTATSLSGGVNRTARTDGNGRFTITFPGSEGDYFVTVIAIGFVPRRFEVKRTADQDILIADTRLTPTSSTLDTVVTVGQRSRPVRGDTAADVGGTQRAINPGLVATEQLGNLAAMAASVAGVLYIQGVDGDPSGYSVLGLDALQNGLTLNGMNSFATDLPRDANVSVSVATSPYDVSQGQFSGGRLNARLGSGSNYVTRTSSLLLNAPQLEWTDAAGRALGQRYTNANLSGSAAGPMSYDKAFYNVAYQLGRRTNDLPTLLNTDPLGLATIGIASDSVRRLLGLLDNARVPATVPGFPTNQLTDQGVILGSLDFAPPSSSSGQAFNVTFNGSWNRTSPASSLTKAVPASSFDATRWDGAVQGHHTNYFAAGILSETGLAVSASHQYGTPYLDLPGGSVLVNSSFAGGQNAVQSIAFGGSLLRSGTRFTSFDLTNQLSWFSMNNKHRVKLTSELRRDAYALDNDNNTLGFFAFNSLADLQAGTPASFVRQLTNIRHDGRELIAALSLGDSYRASQDLQIVYGARLDANRFLDQPATNPDVERLFGARNDVVPNGVFVSPRVGFSWTYGTASEIGAFQGAARVPRAVIRGGIGVFQNAVSASLPSQAIANTGLATGVQNIVCAGAATPVPNWSAYAADPTSVPRQCADGSAGTVFSNAAPNVTLFTGDYGAQRSVRSTLQWAGAVLDNRFLANVTATYSLNRNQPGFVDRNVDATARFTLSGEDNRPVFVQPTSIVPATGAVASRDGRVSPLFNHLTELRSDLSSVSRQVTVLLSPRISTTQYTWGLSYTLNSVRDRANGFSSTAGNPFDVGAARGALDWRHQVLFSAGYNFFDAVRLFWVQSFLSGLPYTPMVVGDVNGDGYAANDRAFVFSTASPDAALALGMNSLLAGASSGARECLTRQLNQLAARNSCAGPWTSTASMRIDFNLAKVRMPRRTMISFSVANPLAAADLLLHGESRSHGWGQAVVPDPRLLVVRGFDPQARRFTYQVNQRFGSTSPAANAARNPVTVTAVVRVNVGPTRERQDLTRALDRGRSAPGRKLSSADLKGAYGSAGLINPMSTILRASDTLRLTGRQADSIATLNRWYVIRMDSIWSLVARDYATLPDQYDRGAAYERYRRAREASVDLIIKVAPSIHSLLTAEQRRKLPSVVASYLDLRYLAAVRSGTEGLAAAVFPTGVGVPNAGGQGRGRGGGPGGG